MKKHLTQFKKRDFSWSSYSSWYYDREQWARKYLLGIEEKPSKEMAYGTRIHELLSNIPSFRPDVPRLDTPNFKLQTTFAGIPLVGYLDFFMQEPCAFYEYKTYGKKDRWTQESSEEHGQLQFYMAMLFLIYKVKPEHINASLIALQVEETGDFRLQLTKEPCKIFEVRKTTKDILKFLGEIKKTHAEMCEFAKNYETP